MKTKITLIIVILLVATLLNPSFAMASGHQANVFIVHGIPGQDVSPDLDPALPVDVSVNGACALPGFKFGEIVGPLPLDPGDYEIAISLANPDDPCSNDPVLGPITLPFEAGKAYSVVAHLTEAGGITASLFPENISRVKPPKARVIVHHTAAAPAVDISIVRGPVPTLVIEDFSNGDQATAKLFPGKWTVKIAPAGTDTVVFETQIRLSPKKTHLVYAVGSVTSGTFTLLLKTYCPPK